jgi:hypothetical protein
MESASQSCPPQEAAELPSSGNQRPAAEGSAQAEEAVWQQCALESCAASLPAAATPPLPDSYAAQASSSRPQSAAEGSVCSEGSAHLNGCVIGPVRRARENRGEDGDLDLACDGQAWMPSSTKATPIPQEISHD